MVTCLLALHLEKFQHRVKAIVRVGFCSCRKGASLFFLCPLVAQKIKELYQPLNILFLGLWRFQRIKKQHPRAMYRYNYLKSFSKIGRDTQSRKFLLDRASVSIPLHFPNSSANTSNSLPDIDLYHYLCSIMYSVIS